MSHQSPVAAEGELSNLFDAEEWSTFKSTHNKKYESEEDEKKRIKIFLETKAEIAKHNAEYEKGNVSYSMKINQFADMTPEEKKRYC